MSSKVKAAAKARSIKIKIEAKSNKVKASKSKVKAKVTALRQRPWIAKLQQVTTWVSQYTVPQKHSTTYSLSLWVLYHIFTLINHLHLLQSIQLSYLFSCGSK